MNDWIERQVALSIAKDLIILLDGYQQNNQAVNNYCAELVKLPSVQPERKKGMWYKPTGMMPPEYAGVYRCSVCEEFAPRDWKRHIQILTNFCPNCGADMRDESDG